MKPPRFARVSDGRGAAGRRVVEIVPGDSDAGARSDGRLSWYEQWAARLVRRICSLGAIVSVALVSTDWRVRAGPVCCC
jgi:hypothetical protein